MFNFKIMYFCNIEFLSQTAVKNSNQDPHNAVWINARNYNEVTSLQKFPVLILLSTLSYCSTMLPMQTACHFPSAGKHGGGRWGGRTTLTWFNSLLCNSTASCGNVCKINPSTLRDPSLSITCLKPFPI